MRDQPNSKMKTTLGMSGRLGVRLDLLVRRETVQKNVAGNHADNVATWGQLFVRFTVVFLGILTLSNRCWHS